MIFNLWGEKLALLKMSTCSDFVTHLKGCCCELCAMLGLVTSRGEDFNPGQEMSCDHLDFLCNRILLKYKREKSSDIDIRRGRKNAHLLVFSKVFYVC